MGGGLDARTSTAADGIAASPPHHPSQAQHPLAMPSDSSPQAPRSSTSPGGRRQQQQQQQQPAGSKKGWRFGRRLSRFRSNRNLNYGSIGEMDGSSQMRGNHVLDVEHGDDERRVQNLLKNAQPMPRMAADNDSSARSRRSQGDGTTTALLPRVSAESVVVPRFESILRGALLLATSFFLGTCFPVEHELSGHVLNYIVVAYVTCVILWLAVRFEKCHHRQTPQAQPQEDEMVAMEENLPLLLDSDQENKTDDHDLESSLPSNHQRNLSLASSVDTAPLLTAAAPQPQRPALTHPALEPLYITDEIAGRVASLNNPQLLHVMDTDYFSGYLMGIIRTPDVDDASAVLTDHPNNAQTAEYLRGKMRRFEFQFQGKLKRLPTGRLYFASELDQAIKLGMIQRAFVGAAMAFVKSTNPFFHYSISGDASVGEPPHMAFPFLEGMDRVVATPPGQTPPKLGEAIYEPPESIKKRAKGKRSFEWNLQDTYTFALWSAYVDFLSWKCLNLPGIRPFGLTSVLGLQPIHLMVYEMDEKADHNPKGPHIRSDDKTLVRLELCHSRITKLGPATQQALASGYVSEASNPITSAETPPHTGLTAEAMALTEEEEPVALGTAVANVATIMEADSDEESEEEEAAAELGEGIYIRSGDPIVVKETSVETSDETSLSSSGSSAFVGRGGGFCVLREQHQQPSWTLVIEKAKAPSRRRRRMSGSGGGNSLIKSGDTVLFKLIKTDGTILYLSIHRGWWLKWVTLAPNKNGHFTIHTTDGIAEDEEYDQHGSEPQSSYLTIGGSFWLQHKKWSKFSVGVALSESTTYGGRLLGLFKGGAANKDGSVQPQNVTSTTSGSSLATSAPPSMARFEDAEGWDEDAEPDAAKAPTEWMKPVFFRAFEGGATALTAPTTAPITNTDLTTIRPAETEETAETGKSKLRFSAEDARMDVPLWIELLNRTERVRHLAYVVRVVPPLEEEPAFVRIRTGRDLAEVMRAGQNWRNRVASPNTRRRSQKETVVPTHGPRAKRLSTVSLESRNSGSNLAELVPGSPQSPKKKQNGVEGPVSHGGDDDEMKDAFDDSDPESDEEAYVDGDDVDFNASNDSLHSQRKREPRKFIGKLARSMKHRTSAVVKVSKGTVSAGKSLVPIRAKNPPKQQEPNQKTTTRSRRRTERDLHVAVSRSMKKLQRNESLGDRNTEDPSFVAGELSAPDQSCRTASRMLAKMSSVPRGSDYYAPFNSLLNAQVNHVSDHDSSFLHGKALDLGVSPSKKYGEAISGCVVARCIWEGHWREEWCGLYHRSIVFCAPLTDTANLELSLADVQSFRLLDVGSRSPLPGFPIMVLETAWMCYYVAFLNDEVRASFYGKLDAAKDNFENRTSQREGEQDLWKARFWQGFRSSFDASLSGGKGKWAEIVFSNRKKRRVVLNNRRMAFDLPPFPSDLSAFCENLLFSSLSFSLESLLEHPEALGRFLDATSQLQNLPLNGIDFMSPEAFCIFANLYHCLLQHALLLTVNGPLTKRSVGHFMRTSCYEIGGDVFSLAELQLCVIRGHMSRPVAPKAPFFDASKRSNTFQYYALGFTSPLFNFVLNTGNVLSPRQVAIFKPDQFYEQLTATATAYVRENLTLDEDRRIVYVPRVCEVFRGDFSESGSLQACLKYCMLLLEETVAAKIERMLKDTASLTVKFQTVHDQYHSTLQSLRNPPVAITQTNAP